MQLAGCTVCGAADHVHTFPSFALAAGAKVTVHTGPGSSDWNNTGDTATLKRPDGGVISTLARP